MNVPMTLFSESLLAANIDDLMNGLFPLIILALAVILILRGGQSGKSLQQWNRYLERATEHLETAEAHMQRVEEKLDRLITLQDKENQQQGP